MISRILSAIIRVVIRFYERILGPMVQITRRSRSRMPVFAYLLALFPTGRRAPRAVPWLVVRHLPDFPLSSMGRQWL